MKIECCSAKEVSSQVKSDTYNASRSRTPHVTQKSATNTAKIGGTLLHYAMFDSFYAEYEHVFCVWLIFSIS